MGIPFLRVSTAALLASTPALATAQQLRVGRQVRIDQTPGQSPSSEVTQAASTANPLVGLCGWNEFIPGGSRSAFGVTRDGGETWEESVVRPALPFQSAVEADPMTAYDPRTGTLWAGAISFGPNGGVYCARLEPGQTDFEPAQMIQVAAGADKGWMAAGPDPADLDRTLVYAAYNFGVARSTDLGDTWQGPVTLGSGVGFLPRTGPNGELYVAYWDFDSKHLLRRSFDGGVTFGAPITIVDRMDVYGLQENSAIPGFFRAPSLQGFAVDPSSCHLYCVYFDTTSQTGTQKDVDVYLTKSTDQGVSWSIPTIVNGDSSFEQDQFFPWIEVDDDGGLHVIFYDTRHNAQLDEAGGALLDTYYAYSDSDGAAWTEFRLTPNSWDSQDALLGGGFTLGYLGDYIGLSAGGGRVLPSYMATTPATGSDIMTNVVLLGPAQVVCQGLLCPCANDDPNAGCGNSGSDGDPATGASMTGSGSPSVAVDDLTITVSGLEPNQFSLIFASQSLGSATIGDGHFCIGGALKRYPVQQANASGSIQLGPGQVVSLAQGATTAFGPSPGETWYYQAVYRDPAGPCGAGINVTSAVSVLWE